MAEKYVAFIPTAHDAVPEPEAVQALVEALFAKGAVQGARDDASTWRNGPGCGLLFHDTDPKPALDGEGLGSDPGKMAVRIDQGPLRGYAGDNLEPVACAFCSAELPYDEAQDAFIALEGGEPEGGERLQMECFHCGESNPAVTADFGRSGGFARFALVFTGETSNRVEPSPEGLRLLAATVGLPMKFVQIFGW